MFQNVCLCTSSDNFPCYLFLISENCREIKIHIKTWAPCIRIYFKMRRTVCISYSEVEHVHLHLHPATHRSFSRRMTGWIMECMCRRLLHGAGSLHPGLKATRVNPNIGLVPCRHHWTNSAVKVNLVDCGKHWACAELCGQHTAACANLFIGAWICLKGQVFLHLYRCTLVHIAQVIPTS